MPIPTPEPGLVIPYAYLWREEFLAGREEGGKVRPSVVVLVVEQMDDSLVVTVLPITRSPPREADAGVEIRPAVKRHLGLDDARSWIIVSEGNEFVWPGFDLSKRARSDRYDYGFIPPHLLDRVRTAFDEWRRAHRTGSTPR